MGKVYEALDDSLRQFIQNQHVFFVATAPLAVDGHVNVSPKGLDSFRILGPRKVAYVDYPGSGIETVAHVVENGRITLMFCAFEGPPRILRLHGTAQVIEPEQPEYAELLARFSPKLAVRAIIVIRLKRIGDSCGFGVPRFAFVEERDQLVKWAQKKGPAGLVSYRQEHNARSLDGLAGLGTRPRKDTPKPLSNATSRRPNT